MLHLLSQQKDVRIAALVTTFNHAENRVAMHAVRRSLVEAQAERIGIPLWPVELPWPCSNAEYEEIMRGVWRRALAEGIVAVAFGDLFPEHQIDPGQFGGALDDALLQLLVRLAQRLF